MSQAALRSANRGSLAELKQATAPTSLAAEHRLAVSAGLAELVGPGLRRGSSVECRSASLGLAVAADASRQGAWCAAVGCPDLGLAAAAEWGIELSRFPQVPAPDPSQWGAVVAALVDAFDVVLVRAPDRVSASDERRLTARARERGAVLVRLTGRRVGSEAGVGDGRAGRRGDGWPTAADLVLEVRASQWVGVGDGWGCLRGRRAEIEVSGRRGAARPTRRWMWLPHPDGGGLVPADPPPSLATVSRLRPSAPAGRAG